MKKNNTGKRPFARLAMAALFATASLSVGAQTQQPPAEISYAGSANNQLLFVVGLENEAQQPFTLEIRDAAGFIFYNSRFTDKTFRKTFALDLTEFDANELTIQVRTKNGVQTQTFQVSTKLSSDVQVVKR